MRTQSEGKHLLALRIIQGGERKDILTGLYCEKEPWNPKTGRPHRLDKPRAAINDNPDLVQRKAHEIFEEMKYSVSSFTGKNDVPGVIKPATVYIARNEGYAWQQVFMKRSCGCEENLHMNLIPEYQPHWKYETKSNSISLKPSVHRQVGCKSYFFSEKEMPFGVTKTNV